MFKKFVKSYYNFLDKKVKNGTLVVFVVVFIILLLGFFYNQDKTLSHIKTSLIESKII